MKKDTHKDVQKKGETSAPVPPTMSRKDIAHVVANETAQTLDELPPSKIAHIVAYGLRRTSASKVFSDKYVTQEVALGLLKAALQWAAENPKALDSVNPNSSRAEIAFLSLRVTEQLGHVVRIERPVIIEGVSEDFFADYITMDDERRKIEKDAAEQTEEEKKDQDKRAAKKDEKPQS